MRTCRYLLSAVLIFFALAPACDLSVESEPPDDPRDKFLGEWGVNENCRRMNYSVEVEPDPGNSTQVFIYNFGNPGPGYDPAVGLVTSNSIYVSSQTIGEGWTVSGRGNYQKDGSVLWDYSLVIGPSLLECTATYTR